MYTITICDMKIFMGFKFSKTIHDILWSLRISQNDNVPYILSFHIRYSSGEASVRVKVVWSHFYDHFVFLEETRKWEMNEASPEHFTCGLTVDNRSPGRISTRRPLWPQHLSEILWAVTKQPLCPFTMDRCNCIRNNWMWIIQLR